ncbi:MAG: antibiotic ABC transporter ATP-binding protein [Flammeovirgaceae bacterium]|nr:antibiotic ABC transporter ATP-binding protein [Flammeovirgaceae bacterium]|tara:strand:+ start:51 stop:1886 length:1836 start_codon:yes stop_codon:yes gene_type:complete
MKTYLRILSEASPFGKILPLYLLLTVLYIVFSMVNYSVLIPLLEVLFNQVDLDDIEKMGEIKNFEFSIEYIRNIFYSHFNELIVNNGRQEALKFVCYVMLTSVFFANLFRYFSAIMIARVRVRVVTNLRNSLYDKIINFKINFFTDKKKGDVISRLTSDIQQIENSVINSVTVLFKEPAFILGLFFILSTISTKLTFYTLILVPISGYLISTVARRLKIKAAFSQTALGKINNIINETLDGIRIIKLFTANNFMRSRFRNEVNDYGKQNLSMYKRFELSNPITEFLGIATVALLLLIGGEMVLNNSSLISASEFIAFIIIFSQVLPPAKALTTTFNTVQRGLASADRVFEYIDKQEIIEEDKGLEKITDIKNSISFNNVYFAYKNKNVLKDISFKIKKGDKIAIVGPSGSGKSTIIDLISKFYKVKSGDIKIDGKNINSYNTYDIRKLIGIVTQESLLFHDSIRNNITFGTNEIDEDKMIESARIANAFNFIDNLDDKFDTEIGERGLKLSGGQRQRICIARAIYKDPPILIFDEATSSLDSKSEISVQKAVEEVMKDRTSIIIAHRLSTIKNVDKIIVIEDGKIIEMGSHQELIKKDDFYSKLSKMQNLS